MRRQIVTQEQPAQPHVMEVHGSQLRYTMARIKSAGYEVLDVQRNGSEYIIVVAMPPEAQLPERTTRRRRQLPVGPMLRGVGSGLIVIAIGVAVLGPAVTMLGTGVGTGLTAAAGGALAASVILLPATLITLLILSLLPAAARFVTQAQREYKHTRRSE